MIQRLKLAFSLVLGMVLLLEAPPAAAMDVLVLHPLHGASHEGQLRILGEELLRRGHHVTIVRFRGDKRRSRNNAKAHPESTSANLTVITLSVPNDDGSIPFITKGRHGHFQLPLERLWRLGLCPLQVPFSAFYTNDALCKVLLPPDGRLRRRLNRYDIALVDAFANECGLALAHDLNTPAVTYWALPLSGGEGDYAAGLWRPPPMANSPAIMTKLSDQMSYLQRVHNAAYRMAGHVVMSIQFWVTNLAIQRYLPGIPHPRRLVEDVAGLLENSDVALDYPRALPPNVINVGCMQCRPPKPLSQELEEFVEGSDSAGIVVFSMGATIDAAVAPKAFFRRLLNVFARLPQRVLMKFDGSVNGEEIPPNVRILAWMPQQDLLGHRRTRAFFSHCGLHGAMEAVYHGVPVVGMPVFGDQTDVATMLVERGMGVRLSKDSSEDEIYRALSEVIGDPRYRRNALKRREILLDAPQNAMERAVGFLEYIARHNGAPHLRLATRHYSAAQHFGLDVLPVLILSFSVFLYVTNKVIRTTLQTLYSAVAWVVSKMPIVSDIKSHAGNEKLTPRLVESIPISPPWIDSVRKLLRRFISMEMVNQGLLVVTAEMVKSGRGSPEGVTDGRHGVHREGEIVDATLKNGRVPSCIAVKEKNGIHASNGKVASVISNLPEESKPPDDPCRSY